MSDIEYREFDSRYAKPTASEGRNLSGQAAPFMSPTIIGGAFREQISPKAWNKTLADGDQVLLDNHNQAKPIARKSAGTLNISTNSRGVQWTAQAANTSYANDVLENVRAGNYGGCSFSFTVPKGGDTWEEPDTRDGLPLRTLNEIKVREISIVTFPAYADTSVAARQVELGMEAYARATGAPRPYGDVKYADPVNGKYPVDTAEHAKAAWDFINQAKNAAEYPLNGVKLSAVKAAIKKAAKSFGVEIEQSNSHVLDDVQLRKLQRRMDAARIASYEGHLAEFEPNYRFRARSELAIAGFHKATDEPREGYWACPGPHAPMRWVEPTDADWAKCRQD